MIMNFWVQVALTINQQCNPIAFDAWEPYYYKLYIVYTVSAPLFASSPP
jgi:hypothetical protein